MVDSTESARESPVPIHHLACNGVAFHYDHLPMRGEPIKAAHVVPPRLAHSLMICETCGRLIRSTVELATGPVEV